MASDYYSVLRVSKDASTDEIKRACRKLAVKYHPDKEGGDEAKFKEVAEAYEVLKDPAKRQRYDQFGHATYQQQAQSGGSGYGPFHGFGGQQFEFDMGDLDLGDIFGSFFGGRRSTTGRRGRTVNRGRDVETRITLDFKEAVFGTEKTVSLDLEDHCSHCKGKMAEPGSGLKTCSSCNGQGRVVQTQSTILGSIQHATVCPECHGRGQIPEKACNECGGKGTKRTKQSTKVKVPAGVDDGTVIKLRARGEAAPGGVKGDLYVHIKVRSSHDFKRRGRDIVSSVNIDMAEAALGTEISVNTVDGAKKMKLPAGTQSGQVFRLSGRGVPFGDRKSRGDHLVNVNVVIPKKLSTKQKELLEEFAKNSKKGWFK